MGLLISNLAYAKPQNADQVVPVGNAQDDLVVPDPKSQAQDDAIHAKILKSEEVNEDAAQNRTVPPPASSHTYVVPSYGVDDGAYESAAGTLSAKTKSPSVKRKPATHFASVHVGSYDPTNLMGDTAGITYDNVYNNATVPMVQFDEEWDITRKFGKLGYKAGLGFFTASGDGRFVNIPALQSEEPISLYVIPMTLAGIYHFQYADRQPVAPYIEGGVDYFGMFEIANQSISTFKFGGGATAHYAAGLAIQLDFLDRSGVWHMYKEYGIQHLYFIGGMRQFFALSSVFDFSAVMYEGGFAFEF
jgi:hypothetical protein